VSHVHVGHGPGLYALARGADREYLTCDRCGHVTTLEPAALDAVRAALHADFGHHARFSHFPIHGLCAGCAEADPEHGHHHAH
jgi:Fur family ferric uptake transcriptional regulator